MNTELFYDWSTKQPARQVKILDDTLRDGLQAPHIKNPTVSEKIEMIDLMVKNNVSFAAVAFPASSPKAYEEADLMAMYIAHNYPDVIPAFAARTVLGDLKPIVDLQQKAGRRLYSYTFIGCSPIRQRVEEWDMNFILNSVATSMNYLSKNNAGAVLVIEDSTRGKPEDLRHIIECGLENGAEGICLADTCGSISPRGVGPLISFVRDIVGDAISLEWHGHNDRGLALANALTAIDCGVDVVHVTSLGIGERTGNLPLEQLLVNLYLEGHQDIDLSFINDYVLLTAKYLDISIPNNKPIIGRDIFTTGTGVHAAAILKALEKENIDLVDTVYSSVPASKLHRKQNIEVGAMSGKSNVKAKLKDLGIKYSDELADIILNKAKTSNKFLLCNEIVELTKNRS